MLKKGSAAAKAFMSKLRTARGKKTTLKKVGALPIGFTGKIWEVSFKVVNQFDIYNNVSSIVENSKSGTKIVIFDGVGTAAEKAQKFYDYIVNNSSINPYGADAKKLKSRLLKFSKNLQKEVKEYNKGNKKTIKKQPLNIPIPKTKKPTVKKPAAKKTIKKTFSNREYDIRHQAMKPGKRISKEGNKYTENRENRSDKGKLLGIGDIPKKTLEKIKENLELIESLKNRQIPLMKQEAKILKGPEKTKKLYNIKYAIDFMATLKKQNTMLKKHI